MSAYTKYHKCHRCGWEWLYFHAWRLPMFEYFCPRCGALRKEMDGGDANEQTD